MDVSQLAARLEPVLRSAGVQVAYLFGSQASGQARDDSDVDVAVLLGGSFGLLDEQHLVALIEGELGQPVDVVVLDRASLELRGHVVQTGRLLFSDDEPARVAFEVRTRSEYFDYLPTLRDHTRRYLEHVANERA